MSGRVFVSVLAAFLIAFAGGLWWFQTWGHYTEVSGLETVRMNGVAVPVSEYRGIDAETSPLKMRGCFRVGAVDGPPAPEAEPLVAPGWFDCFDAETISVDLATGGARALLAEFNTPYGFDRIVAVYPDGRAVQWRQINRCGDAAFKGDPLPTGCPAKE